jgi:hypothetical protein
VLSQKSCHTEKFQNPEQTFSCGQAKPTNKILNSLMAEKNAQKTYTYAKGGLWPNFSQVS